MKIALVGQPNCGKSTIFNSVAGYRTATGNFPGTTVQLTWSRVRLDHQVAELVDLPGIYSLTSNNPAESASKKFLLSEDPSLIVNVLDASLLSRSLELTLELRELGIPMVVCLNMTDEAQRRGIRISAQQLSALLGLPVVEAVAYRGVGVRELFREGLRQIGQAPEPAEFIAWHRDVETTVGQMERQIDSHPSVQKLPSRFVAIKLLENDREFCAAAAPEVQSAARQLRDELEGSHGRPAESVVMSERHDVAMRLFEEAATVTRPRSDPRAALDNLLTHPIWGYVFLLAVLVAFFWAVFGFGSVIEREVTLRLNVLTTVLLAGLPPSGVAHALVAGLMDGVQGGAGSVLP